LRDQRLYSFWDRGDGVGGVCAPQRRRRDLGQPDGSDLAFGDKAGKCADTLLDRNRGVEAVEIVKIDDVGAQVGQGLLTCRAERLRPAVDHPHPIDSDHAALARQHDLVAPGGEDLADEALVGPEPVKRGRVEMGDTEIQGAEQEPLRLGPARQGMVDVAEVHAPEADRCHGNRAEPSRGQLGQ
jgi:hypothetical protein